MPLRSIAFNIRSFFRYDDECASTVLLFLLLAISLFSLSTQAKYGGGSGEPNDPYLIYDANQMNAIGAEPNDWDKHFKMTADIDLVSYTGTQFNIIGTGENQPFSGSFDGNGHTISHFSYISESGGCIGLFGYVNGLNAHIKDLRLFDANVDAGTGSHVGSLVGSLEHGTISRCGVAGGSVLASGPVGGFVGANADGTITNCWCSGSVSGGQGVGGLTAVNNGTITNCYSTGCVSGIVVVGGLVGFNGSKITNCYAVGTTYGSGMVGGLVAHDCEGAGKAVDSFWDVNSTGQTSSAGGIPKTTSEMQMQSTFTNWDFDNVWTICEGRDYPRLRWQNYGGGCGKAHDPYLIRTSRHMQAIGAHPNDWDKHFKLMADIDLSSYTAADFNTIGYYISPTDTKPFTGVFDGNGHTISNFSYTSTDRNYVALFAYVNDPNAEIENLRLADPNINARQWAASLVGYLEDGIVTGCCVDGGNISGGSTGGLVGVSGSTISDCSLSANVDGGMFVGGLVGMNDYGTITNCHSKGTVSGISQIGGGLVAANSGTIINCYSGNTISGLLVIGGLVGVNGGTITNCFSKGGVLGQSILGGLVGLNRTGQITKSYAATDVSGRNTIGGLVGSSDEAGSITGCYAAGHVSGEDCIGGLVGRNAAAVGTSFWDTDTSDVNNMCGSQGTGGSGCDDTNGKTTSEMQTQSTFTNWDFVSTWDICEGTNYPRLLWQIPPADFLCPDGVDMSDFAVLAAQWQEPPSEPCADIVPAGGDGIVDWLDLAALSESWLAGP
jgi:hypothetical protein